MLRKIFIFICVIFILSAMLFSCGEKSDDKADDVNDTKETTMETEEIITTAAPVTEPPGPKKSNKWITFAETDVPGDQNAVKVGDGGGFKAIGAKFTAEFIITDISISCPSWSDDIGSMIFKIFKWDTDYATTVAGEPVFIDTETFVDYPDNSMMEVSFEPEIEPGTYLWELSEGKDGVGVWAFKTHGEEGLEFYRNGELFPDGTAFNAEINGYIMVDP